MHATLTVPTGCPSGGLHAIMLSSSACDLKVLSDVRVRER